MSMFTAAPTVELGSTVSFEVYPSTLFTTDYKACVLKSLLDSEDANAIVDTLALHRQVFPTLPAGTVPDDPTKYNWLKVQLPNGKHEYLGLPWIKDSSVTLMANLTITVTIPNAKASDVDTISKVLGANGYISSKVEIV